MGGSPIGAIEIVSNVFSVNYESSIDEACQYAPCTVERRNRRP